MRARISYIPITIFLVLCSMHSVSADDALQWGIDQGRNRIADEKNLPVFFEAGRRDPVTNEIVEPGPNVRWAARIGSRTYTPPVVAEGRVLIGTNNDVLFEPEIEGDQGVMLCLDEKTGKFLWQHTAPKVKGIKFFDTEMIGITSTPTVRNGRVWFVDNRGTVCALKLSDGSPIWILDLVETFGVRQHDANNCSIVVHEGLLYLGTANGQDDRHQDVERPEAPSFLVLDAETGRALARDAHWLKTGIAHGQWCSPCLGEVRNVDGNHVWTIFYVLGNGVLHAMKTLNRNELLKKAPAMGDYGEFGSKLAQIEPDWIFNGNGAEIFGEEKPFQVGRGSASFVCLPPPIFVDNRLYLLFCIDATTGARPHRAFMTAFDPSLLGRDPNSPGRSPRLQSRLQWKTPMIEKGVLSPQAVSGGLLYFGDRNGGFYCLDAENGETLWKLDLKGEHWGGPLVADGKIYIGTNRRMFYVLREGRESEILAEIEMPDAIYAGATAANGTLFVPGNGFLYAIEELRPQESAR